MPSPCSACNLVGKRREEHPSENKAPVVCVSRIWAVEAPPSSPGRWAVAVPTPGRWPVTVPQPLALAAAVSSESARSAGALALPGAGRRLRTVCCCLEEPTLPEKEPLVSDDDLESSFGAALVRDDEKNLWSVSHDVSHTEADDDRTLYNLNKACDRQARDTEEWQKLSYALYAPRHILEPRFRRLRFSKGRRLFVGSH